MEIVTTIRITHGLAGELTNKLNEIIKTWGERSKNTTVLQVDLIGESTYIHKMKGKATVVYQFTY